MSRQKNNVQRHEEEDEGHAAGDQPTKAPSRRIVAARGGWRVPFMPMNGEKSKGTGCCKCPSRAEIHTRKSPPGRKAGQNPRNRAFRAIFGLQRRPGGGQFCQNCPLERQNCPLEHESEPPDWRSCPLERGSCPHERQSCRPEWPSRPQMGAPEGFHADLAPAPTPARPNRCWHWIAVVSRDGKTILRS
jgi:hypothetical protein